MRSERLSAARQDGVVEEGEASDQISKTPVQLSSTVDNVTVVTEQFHKGKHGKTSMLKFRKLTALKFFVIKRGVGIGVEEEYIVVNGTDQEEDLGPSQGGNGVDGLDSVGDGVGGDGSRDEVVVGTAEFGPHVSNHTKHGNTSVLELSFPVTVERFLVNVLGKAEGIYSQREARMKPNVSDAIVL